jgi:hypothetical protein
MVLVPPVLSKVQLLCDVLQFSLVGHRDLAWGYQMLRAWLGPTVFAKVAAPRFLYCCSLEELGGRREERGGERREGGRERERGGSNGVEGGMGEERRGWLLSSVEGLAWSHCPC